MLHRILHPVTLCYCCCCCCCCCFPAPLCCCSCCRCMPLYVAPHQCGHQTPRMYQPVACYCSLLRRHLRLDGTNATSRPPPKRHVAAAAAAAAASNYLRPHQNHQAPQHFRFTPGFFGILWQLVLGQHFSTFFPTRALTIPPSIMSSCSSSGTVAQRLLLSPSHLQPLKPNSIS